MSSSYHLPVLPDEVIEYLNPQPGKTYVDATVGGGGHSRMILDKIQPDGFLLGLDQDPAALAAATEALSSAENQASWQVVRANFSDVATVLQQQEISKITGGVLVDLGVSSHQLDTAARGFSFSKNAPLDMRMNPDGTLTAADIVNTWRESELVRIFSDYGEERFSKTIARLIVEQRGNSPIKTTKDLAQLVESVYRKHKKNHEKKIHPATQVFQALRIAVNDEFRHLEKLLNTLPELLAPGARIAIISFHSLEDRIVKQFFKQQSIACICPPNYPVCQCNHQAQLKLLTGKPVTASDDEIKTNPRSRSAKLRVAEKLA